MQILLIGIQSIFSAFHVLPLSQIPTHLGSPNSPQSSPFALNWWQCWPLLMVFFIWAVTLYSLVRSRTKNINIKLFINYSCQVSSTNHLLYPELYQLPPLQRVHCLLRQLIIATGDYFLSFFTTGHLGKAADYIFTFCALVAILVFPSLNLPPDP